MPANLSCWSFHSVKGGVGKSTLATLAAVQLAHDHPDELVWLVDMDLTGTSLADVLALNAPDCERCKDGTTLNLERPARGLLTKEQTLSAIDKRMENEKRLPVSVPFLNDYLLFATENWDEEHDARLDALSWSPAGESGPGDPTNLRILPSSALPHDLDQTLPLIFDEEHAAFLENRLEYLLSAMLCEPRRTHVVFDVPPTIPGLSRAVLSLALRLGLEDEKVPLSLDGGFPEGLEVAPISWRAVMMTTQDIQDVRAVDRWLERVEPGEEPVFRVLFNRADRLTTEQRAQWLEDAKVFNRLLDDAHWLEHDPSLAFFRRSGLPGPHIKIKTLLGDMARG